MVYTNFPQGVTSLGVPVIGSGQLPITQGNYWFVSSTTGSTGNPGNEADLPFATLAGAVAAAVSGDVIVLLPNHAETVSAAGGIAINVAGLTIVGMGEGSTRPTFTFGTSTAATMTISAAAVSISNIVGICNIDQLVSPFVISAADCTFGTLAGPVEWHDGAANKEALRAVLTTAAADRLSITLTYIGFTAGSHGVNAIRLVGCDTGTINIDYYGICTTAVIEFVTTACVNVTVNGYVYVSGVTNYTKDVVDTVTGSTWFANLYDGAFGGQVTGGSASAIAPATSSVVITDLGVPALDSTANVLERDVIGNKTDTGVTATGATKSILAYTKGLVTMNTVQAANSVNNAFAGDVIGNKTDAAVYFPSTTKSLMALLQGASDVQEMCFQTTAAVLAAGTATIITVTGGPIMLLGIMSISTTVNDATATLLNYNALATLGGVSTNLCGATATLANAAAGTLVAAKLDAAATAGVITAGAVAFPQPAGYAIVPAGVIRTITSGGASTGLWVHYIRYRPLARGVSVA